MVERAVIVRRGRRLDFMLPAGAGGATRAGPDGGGGDEPIWPAPS